jgi:hypothetical protein
MSTSEEAREIEAPPAGERIHMPAPSVLPLVNATALAIAILNITGSMFLLVAGLVVFVVTAGLWIRDTRRDIEHLPADHH